MIYHTNLIILSATIWDVFSGIGTLLGAIVAAVYTYLTYHLLSKTKESLDLTTKAINLNEKSLDANNKLVEFQMFTEITRSLYTEPIQILIQRIKDNPQITFTNVWGVK